MYSQYKKENGFFGSMGLKFLKNMVETAAWKKDVEIYDDKTGEKKGLKDWINLEVLEAVLSGIESQILHQFDVIKPLMGAFYRFNL